MRRLREQAGISQEELAFRTSLDRTYVSMLERGRRQPSLATVEKVAEALGMKASVFLQLVENDCIGQKPLNVAASEAQDKQMKYLFSGQANDAGELFLVELEEVGEGAFLVRYGTMTSTSGLERYPKDGSSMMPLEAVQFLGRLRTCEQMPESCRADYKAWLTQLEIDFINQRIG
ncbi:MAG TPA: helix-turn-helix transcriptional regulator [Gallionella sp.]|nr:helix-turn-helix transcriptional regulator [Gallionella sp.]